MADSPIPETEPLSDNETSIAIMQAVARGWCHPNTEHKIMDEALALAITDETERVMLDALHVRYSQKTQGTETPRYAVAEQVRNKAGFQASRSADFMAMDCWPGGDFSGCEIHGHEVKVSRSDWLHELKDPFKAEAFRPFVDRWWLVVSDLKIVKDGELPKGWGLMFLGKDGRLRAKVRAPKLEPEPFPRGMMACFLRATQVTATRQTVLRGLNGEDGK